jgi:predicted permease
MCEEIRAHLEFQEDEFRRAGMNPDEARYAALRAFGGVEQIKELIRERRAGLWLEQTGQDVRYAISGMRKTPGFALVVIAILAVAIAAATVVLSAARGMLLRPLPFSDGERLAWIYSRHPASGVSAERMSLLDFTDVKTRAQSFSAVALIHARRLTLAPDAGPPQALEGLAVTPDLFDVLGLAPALGRRFVASDLAQPDEAMLISYELWTTRFAASPNIIGMRLRFGAGKARTVVGVLPPGLEFPLGRVPQAGNGNKMKSGTQDFWILLHAATPRTKRNDRFATMVAKLRPDVDEPRATAELDGIAAALAREHPATNGGWTFAPVPVRTQILGATGPALRTLLFAVALVLLLACANVATLLLSRGIARQPELALRAALGAGRGRILRQLLLEGLVLSAAGGTLGVLLADLALRTLIVFGPASVPFLAQLTLDLPVLSAAVLVSLAAGLLASVGPAWFFSQGNPQAALMSRSRGATDTPHTLRWRNGLVTTQIAATFVLLCGAALLSRSFVRLMHVDLGYTSGSNVLATELDQVKPEDRLALFDRLAQVPWIEAAGAVHSLPLTGTWEIRERFRIAGRNEPPDAALQASLSFVGFDYFRAMGIAVVRGRSFTPQESLNPTSAPVAIVSESFARRFFPGEDALGQVLLAPGTRERRIVGIVRDTRDTHPEIAPEPQFYLPLVLGDMRLVVQTRGEAGARAHSLAAEIAAVAPHVIVGPVTSIDALVAATRAERRFALLLLTVFAAVALAVSAIGLYAVLAFGVAQRRREIGIRLALGASRDQVATLVARQGARLLARGALLGLVLAIVFLPRLKTQLFELSPLDYVSYLVAAALLGGTALLACGLPARCATKVDPLIALRAE